MINLDEVAEISLGIVLNRKKAYEEEGAFKKYKLFSIKGYEEKSYDDFYSIEDLDNKCAQKGDLLFRLTCPNRIIFLNEEIPKDLIIPSQFCIIKSKDENKYITSFFKIFLETEEAKIQIKSNINGTTIKSITVADLKKIKIPEIQITEQIKLSEIISLWEEQKKHLEKLIQDKQYFFNKYIEKEVNKNYQ